MTSAEGGLTLVLGGARAGKTRFAERLAARYGGRICYVATAEPGDDEMRARIAAHRASRPAQWLTVEASRDVAGALDTIERPDALLLDCLTVWTSNVLLDRLNPDALSERGARAAEDAATAAVDALLDWRRAADVPLIVVSNEVGLGVTPPFPLGRLFQDVLGRLNQRLAAAADEVYLVVAGLALPLKRLGAHAIDRPPPLPLD
jgi:adenosylcobinamide kinase/adenosylcobinamide-phosphate guanylyltransferase